MKSRLIKTPHGGDRPAPRGPYARSVPAPRDSRARPRCRAGISRFFLPSWWGWRFPGFGGDGPVKKCLNFWIWVIEIVRNPDISPVHAHGPRLALRPGRDQLGHRYAGPRDGDLLSSRDPPQQPRQVRLGLVNVDFHRNILTKSYD